MLRYCFNITGSPITERLQFRVMSCLGNMLMYEFREFHNKIVSQAVIIFVTQSFFVAKERSFNWSRNIIKYYRLWWTRRYKVIRDETCSNWICNYWSIIRARSLLWNGSESLSHKIFLSCPIFARKNRTQTIFQSLLHVSLKKIVLFNSLISLCNSWRLVKSIRGKNSVFAS